MNYSLSALHGSYSVTLVKNEEKKKKGLAQTKHLLRKKPTMKSHENKFYIVQPDL